LDREAPFKVAQNPDFKQVEQLTEQPTPPLTQSREVAKDAMNSEPSIWKRPGETPARFFYV